MSNNNPNKFQSPLIPDFHCVGWVQSAHGIRGELFVRLHAESADWAEKDRKVQLYLLLPGQKNLVAYTLTSLTPHKNGLIARLAGCDDRNTAETLKSAQVYIPESYLEGDPGDTIFLNQIQGFAVSDKTLGSLGKVIGFGSNGPQDLLRLELVKGGEALVPLVDAFLIHIDFDKKLISMDLPPGLIDLEEE